MHKILVLFAHPALQKSIAHKSLFNEIQNIEGITCHDLYDTYPDSFIDIKHEQTLLLNHDIIVLQFPLYWYSCPAILKEWQDLVLEHGFAYGEHGDKLVGKKIMLAISTGGSMNSYSTAGYNEHDISQFLLPFSQMSKLCNLEYLTPFVVHDIHKRHDPARIARKAKEYRQLLLTLQQQNDDAVAARQENC
ncbi:MAG: NAD(P)H oxidoreductase [Moritella sp.]|nr:MAG: NAD(P)H oxidoreductase [Moritella sp.]